MKNLIAKDIKMISRLAGLTLVLLFGMASVGQSASFDCNKATTEAEIAICGDPELSALDEEIARVYFSLSKDGRYYSDLIKSQREWVKFERTIDAYDFKRRLAFLRFGSHLNTCLRDISGQKWWADCEQQLSNISDECQKLENYTTLVMNRCLSAYIEVLYLVENYETTAWLERNNNDGETLSLFNHAYDLWQQFTKSDCSWQYSFYRDGSIRGLIYGYCMSGHLESRITLLHPWNVR